MSNNIRENKSEQAHLLRNQASSLVKELNRAINMNTKYRKFGI